MLPDEIADGLKTKILAKQIIAYEKTDSTNDVAYRLAEDGAAQGTVIISEYQAKGKGRLGRSWVSPAGAGIYLSIILRPDILPQDAGKFTLIEPGEMLRELRTMIAHTDLSRGLFHANHASNYLPIRARLPKDKESILSLIDEALSGKIALKPDYLRAL